MHNIERRLLIQYNTAQFTYRCVRHACSRNPFRNNHFLFLYELIDHEVQRASDTTANESQENITKENQANEKAAATKIGVDNEPEDYTSIAAETGSSNGKTELRVLLSDTVSSNKEGNHQLTSKQEGKRNRIKSKVVGVVESHEQSEKENTTSLEEKSKRFITFHYTTIQQK